MRYFPKTFVLALFISSLSGTAIGQATGFYRTFQSGGWYDDIWERYNGSVWIKHAPSPSAATSDGILIVAGHEVTVALLAVSADQLRVNGMLTVKSGGLLTIVDDTGTDLEQDHPDAFTKILPGGKLVNEGTIEIKQGWFQFGTIENPGEVWVGGTLLFQGGTISGNPFKYGPGGMLVINMPDYVVKQEDRLWPATDGPPVVRVSNSVSLIGDRSVSDTLDISGELHVAGILASNGITRVSGTLKLSGTLMNNGATDITGTVKMTPEGSVSGNPLVYGGCCNLLEFGGGGNYNIQDGNLFWPGVNGPGTVSSQLRGLPAASPWMQAAPQVGWTFLLTAPCRWAAPSRSTTGAIRTAYFWSADPLPTTASWRSKIARSPGA